MCEHEWIESEDLLLSNPMQQTRYCKLCMLQQIRFVSGENTSWRDYL